MRIKYNICYLYHFNIRIAKESCLMIQKKKVYTKEESFIQNIGKRIREERLRLNLTQEKLAEDVNLSMAYIGQVERGDRSLTLDNLIIVAKRLGVTIDYLLSDCITPKEDDEYRLWSQLMDGRSQREKMLAINMVNLMFRYLDESPAERTNFHN